MDVVTPVEITSQHSLVVFANQVFDHFSCSGVMIFIIPHGWGVHTPDIAVDPIFSPAGLIGLDGRTGTDFCAYDPQALAAHAPRSDATVPPVPPD